MSKPRLFGTDGVRGLAGEGWLAADKVTALGFSAGVVLAAREQHSGTALRALLGHDGRKSGPELEVALARGLQSAGYEVTSTGLLPTPGIAFVGRQCEYDLTAVISASHNPARDNGIKLFDKRGEKLADEIEDEIEAHLRAHLSSDSHADSSAPGDPTHDAKLRELYFEHLLSGFSDLSLTGLKVVLDCANGAGSNVGPQLLQRLGATLHIHAAQPDGNNINANCGATKPEALIKAVREHGADIGIALDGDGDRCILVDETGELVSGDGILTLISYAEPAAGGIRGKRVVATVMSNRGLHRALRAKGIEVVTVGVGDRRVVEALRREKIELGGEQSGHIVFGDDHHYLGDGLYTALRVMRVMQHSGCSLSKLTAPYQPFPQVLVNTPVASKPALERLPDVLRMSADVEGQLGDDGRVLLRYSGTESLVRVMVEGPDEAWIAARAQELSGLIVKSIEALERSEADKNPSANAQ